MIYHGELLVKYEPTKFEPLVVYYFDPWRGQQQVLSVDAPRTGLLLISRIIIVRSSEIISTADSTPVQRVKSTSGITGRYLGAIGLEYPTMLGT